MKKIIKGFLTILFLCLTVSSVSVKADNNDKGTWTKLADSTVNRNGYSSVEVLNSSGLIVVLNDKIYTVNNVNNVNVIEEYDPVTDKWIHKANINSSKYVSSLQVVNNKIYAICSSDTENIGLIEEYDPETNKCNTKTKMLSSGNNRPIAVANNKIYFHNYSSSTLEEYDTQTNKYTVKSSKFSQAPSVVAVANNKIYIFSQFSNKIDEYNPETDKWTAKADTSKVIFARSVEVVNDKIYIIGRGNSTTPNDVYINLVEEYDPETNKCTVKTNMPSKRAWFRTVVLNNKIYSTGGSYPKDSNTNEILNTVEEYNPETNKWTPKANMNIARERHTPIVADNKIYVFGGTGDASKTAEVFTQQTESKNSLNISLDKTSITLLEGETDTLTATVTPKDALNKKIIWTSSDESIATVNANGNVTAVKKGQVKITAKIDGTDVSASCDVNVTTDGDGDGDNKPEISSNSGILSITLVNGITKDYDLSANEITKFTKWYDASNGKGQVRYGFNKKINPYKTVKEYIVFDKIASFEIREYNAEKY